VVVASDRTFGQRPRAAIKDWVRRRLPWLEGSPALHMLSQRPLEARQLYPTELLGMPLDRYAPAHLPLDLAL
jgi:hypothetical protein